jgi:Cft2 family RNA processing exonuclease
MSLYSAKKNNAVEWKGTLSNLPVAVDTFKPIVDHYFLSHAHSDHHFGLKNNYFSKNSTKRIYCTHYTKILICAKYTGLEDYIISLNVNEEKTITVGSTILHVTPLNANHCAGSVMYALSHTNNQVFIRK